MLKGQKVALRPIKRADIQYFLKWYNDLEVTQFLNTSLPMTEMAQEKRIEEFGTDCTRAMFIIEAIKGDSARSIGTTSLTNINTWDHNATFGIAIGEKDYWSKGYGTEPTRLLVNYGFEQLNLHRINSAVIAFNERSLRMHKSIGFKEEGRRRGVIFKNGSYHDEVMLGILRDEWKEIEAKTKGGV